MKKDIEKNKYLIKFIKGRVNKIMSDKRGKWSKNNRNIIWKSYIEIKMWRIFNNLNELKWNWSQQAPCPYCGESMLKAQYQGSQPNKWASWDIDHINGNSEDNRLENLQPMHPICNKKKN